MRHKTNYQQKSGTRTFFNHASYTVPIKTYYAFILRTVQRNYYLTIFCGAESSQERCFGDFEDMMFTSSQTQKSQSCCHAKDEKYSKRTDEMLASSVNVLGMGG